GGRARQRRSRQSPSPRRWGSQSSASSPPPLCFDPVTEPRVRVPLPGDVLELLEVEFFFDLLQRPFLDRGGGFARALRRLAQERVDPLHLPGRNTVCRCWGGRASIGRELVVGPLPRGLCPPRPPGPPPRPVALGPLRIVAC